MLWIRAKICQSPLKYNLLLYPHLFLVQQSISISPDLGGVKLEWENIAEKTVYVHLHIVNGDSEDVRILSSNNVNESIFVRGRID